MMGEADDRATMAGHKGAEMKMPGRIAGVRYHDPRLKHAFPVLERKPGSSAFDTARLNFLACFPLFAFGIEARKTTYIAPSRGHVSFDHIVRPAVSHRL